MQPARINDILKICEDKKLISPEKAMVLPKSLKKLYENEYLSENWSLYVPPGYIIIAIIFKNIKTHNPILVIIIIFVLFIW